MKRLKLHWAVLLMLLLAQLSTVQAQYTPDILGSYYEQRTIVLPHKEASELVATLVRRVPQQQGESRAVLYVHGYNDYFFQADMGDSIAQWGYNFYALDLRRYGRSLRSAQYPFQVESIEEYFEEIDSALHVMRQEGNREIVLMGHSTGGLITALYCKHYRNHLPVEGLILNSPFLDMNMSPLLESVGVPVISLLGKWWPMMAVQQGDESLYAESIHRSFRGEWDFDLDKKFYIAPPITAGWIRAIHLAHKAVQDEVVTIPCPILLMRSDRSVYGSEWSEDFRRGDSVLDVEDISKYGKLLGSDVTETVIEGGLHDLVLSAPAVRDEVYTTMHHWLRTSGVYLFPN